MRTMMVISDEVHRRAKSLAARLGISMANLVEESLLLRLDQARHRPKSKIKPLPVCREGGGLRSGLSLDDMQSIYDVMEEGAPVEKLR